MQNNGRWNASCASILQGGMEMVEYCPVMERVVGKMTRDGAGVRLTRVLGLREAVRFDPFLMLDFFDSRNPRDYVAGFPWHPHRGIETVTFLSEGRIDHGDSLGNSGTIGAGDCQWMTAGSGIIHQEMPKASERMFGVQLWVNLPAKRKMTEPCYRDLRKADIPVVENLAGAGEVRVIAGTYGGVVGPAQQVGVNTRMLEVRLPAGSRFELDVPPQATVFAFLQQGAARFDGESSDTPPVAVRFGEGRSIRAEAGLEGALFLLLSGNPLRETIAWRGPIVMNTEEELDEAFREFEIGSFLRHGDKR